jgi:hypothetical protein
MKIEPDRRGIEHGFTVNGHVSIHGHIHAPEDWHLTCRPLQIFGERICKKGDLKPEQVIVEVRKMLEARRADFDRFISQLRPF